jgi:ligand-binding sensor domain-containing protein
MILGMLFNISPNHWTKLMKKFCFALIILLAESITLLAQNPLLQRFTTSDGLPSNVVNKIFQDSKKFIWFATDAGVSRYDGTKFTYFRKQDGLSSNDVINIAEDSFGRIWFFHTNASLNFFYNNAIHNEKNTPFLDSLKSNDYFNKFFEDPEKNIYFYAHPNRLIYTLDRHNHVNKFQLPSKMIENQITSGNAEALAVKYMTKDDNGDFLLWTVGGFYKMDQQSKVPILLDDSFRFKDVITSSNNQKYIFVRDKDSLV